MAGYIWKIFLEMTCTVKKATNKFSECFFKINAPPTFFFRVFLTFAWLNCMTSFVE